LPALAAPYSTPSHHDLLLLLLLLLRQVNSLVREIEVSHWGNIYVEETYEIVSVISCNTCTHAKHTVANLTHTCYVLKGRRTVGNVQMRAAGA
jgi:hypothetical protein